MSHADLEDWAWNTLIHPKKPIKLTPEYCLDIIRKCAIVFLILDVPILAIGLFLFPYNPTAPTIKSNPPVCRVAQVH
jgi:hypothetical protein